MSKTVIDLDDSLVDRAKKITGLTKKVELVNYALQKLIKQKNIEKILSLKGKVVWSGDLEKMRRGRYDLS